MDQKEAANEAISSWITHPTADPQHYGVYHFRKSFTLSTVPDAYTIHISADNRYRLFLNGIPISSGPARGDLSQWFFETIDLAAYLKPGKNIIAAVVWNMGEYVPLTQFTIQTGLIIQEADENRITLNTGSAWKVLHNKAYTPCSEDNRERLKVYMVVGPGDQVNGNEYPWGWENLNYNDADWENAKEIVHQWNLTPRTIPLFPEYKSRFLDIRRSHNIKVSSNLLTGKSPLTIPAHQKVCILIDESVNTVAYPEIIVSAGNNATIQLTYAEALFDSHNHKGNRDEIDGKEIKGNYDIFISDGGRKRKFRPLWFRTYRYIQLDIITHEEPLIINDIYSLTTGYPFEMKASFYSNDPTLQEIWITGWRTARLCAGELYYDTPYYEQAQYTGDARIQALISLYNAGDDRLMRKAILDFYTSKLDSGLIQSRYPAWRPQVIPAYALFWISMIYDYWMHCEDNEFLKQFLQTIVDILGWFRRKIDPEKNMLGPLPHWNFVDWDNFDAIGTAPGSLDGNSSIITFHYSYTLHQAAELFSFFGLQQNADEFKELAKSLGTASFVSCYDESRNLIADTPEKVSYSQHAAIWAVLSDAVPPAIIESLMAQILNDKTIAQVTYFYRFYLAQALKKAEMSGLYYYLLKPWRDMLALGLTTFAEKPEPTRSDCHAWSASPNYDFLATICGIMPSAPAFSKVLIQPALAELTEAGGYMPHPKGKITVRFKRISYNGIYAEIQLPEGLTGIFSWKNKLTPLHSGFQTLEIT